jgi:predicted phage terminase large subunit-like protein
MHGSLQDAFPGKTFSQDDEELLANLALAEAREDFWCYRKLITRNLLEGWWQIEVAAHLQQFVVDFLAGKRPKLVLQSPRQHGKSTQVQDLVSWLCGLDPDINVIFSSYSERLGIRANLKLQRTFDSPSYKSIFPDTRIPDSILDKSLNKSLDKRLDQRLDQGTRQRNHNIIEFVGRDGSFRNTTVGGRVTGESLDLGVIDDPIKGREEANSEIIRDKTWEWFTDDFMGCFSKKAALLVIGTRYHLDDPVGRMIEHMPGLKVLRYPALAEKDELHRKKGEPLFPELKPLDFLEERKKVLTQAGFLAIYQQSPIPLSGGLFPIEKFKIEKFLPTKEIRRSVRYWDKASVEDGGAYSAGVLMHLMKDKTILISDVCRGQWLAHKRNQIIKQCAQVDSAQFKSYKVVVEQEPGSGGKESAESSIKDLLGFVVEADKVTGSKENRAEPYAAQVQAGNVALLAGDYVREYLNEAETFPGSKYKDQIDASSGAFNKLTLGLIYDDSLSWVDGHGV